MRIGLDEPGNILRSATATNAELLMHKGMLGVVGAGAYAGVLVIDGDPLTDLRVMTHPAKRLKLIMKDGVIFKNEL